MALATGEVKASANYIRMSPHKVRRVLDQIRGRSYREALIIFRIYALSFLRSDLEGAAIGGR